MKFYRDGRPVCMSCKTESQDQAATKLRKEIRKSDEEFTEPRFKRTTVGDLVANLLSYYEANGLDTFRADTLSRWTNHLAPRFKDVKAVQFGSADQQKYRAARLLEKASPATINRELQILRKAFRLGAEAEPALTKRVPKFQITREDNARKGFASREQLEALKIAAAKESLDLRTLVEMAHLFGWRRGELLGLRVSNVHLVENTVRLEDSKNGDAREVPMRPGVRVLVEALVAGKQPTDRLFAFVDFPRKAWERITKAAGCPDLLFHDLRRTSARSKRAAGVDTSITMALMGWRSEAMFRRYGIVATEDKMAALAKQEAYENSYKTVTVSPSTTSIDS